MSAPGPVIALLGAESTGKTTLARALALELRALGHEVRVVDEFLREFCDAQGRTPRPDEQAAIAAEQRRRIEAAAADGSTVLADTTPLMSAVYSALLFGDRSLHAEALAWQRRCRLTLLTGLDLPWQPDGLQRDGPHVRGPVDAAVRTLLAEGDVGYGVVYGRGAARTAAALAALRPALGLAPDAAAAAEAPLRLRGRCRECLVPDCEHLSRAAP